VRDDEASPVSTAAKHRAIGKGTAGSGRSFDLLEVAPIEATEAVTDRMFEFRMYAFYGDRSAKSGSLIGASGCFPGSWPRADGG
jgi:hypothetical protein